MVISEVTKRKKEANKLLKNGEILIQIQNVGLERFYGVIISKNM